MIEVWGSTCEAEFRVAGATQAWWHRDRLLTGLAWDNLAAAAMLRPGGPPASLLMLGLAGGTSLRVMRHLVPEARLTAVEIDPGILELARTHMRLDDLRLKVCLDDAYAWVRAYTGPGFDVVIDDVYQALPQDVARPGVYDDETAEALCRAVAPGGLLVTNLVTGPGHRRFQSHFRRFFQSVFPQVRSVTTPAGANEALVGGALVAGKPALDRWIHSFTDPGDRHFWEILRVRTLTRRGGPRLAPAKPERNPKQSQVNESHGFGISYPRVRI